MKTGLSASGRYGDGRIDRKTAGLDSRHMKDNDFRASGGSVDAARQCRACRSYRSLVVDDETAKRVLMISVLVGSGFRVDAAEDGAVAWDLLRANLIVC